MNVDERDTMLGDLLDRAVSDIEAEEVPTEIVHRGSRRRAGRVVAATAVAAVFVLAIAYAATQFGRDARPEPATPQGWTTMSAADIPWTMPVPPGWRNGASRFVGGPQNMIQDLRFSFVTNAATGLPRAAPSFGHPLGGRAPVSDHAVSVMVDQFVGQGASRPTSLTFNAVQPIAGAPGWTSRDGKICSEWGCVRVYLVYGPDASPSDIETATLVAQGVRPDRVAPSPTVVDPAIRYENQDPEAGFSMEYPAGWVVADDPLTDLIQPSEVVSIGTYDLQPGGHSRQGLNAVLPSALDQLGPEDVFITLQEYEGVIADVRPRPPVFSPETVCSDPRCTDGLALGFEGMRAWWFSFQDAATGRTFSVLVALGEAAFEDPARRDATWEVLNSLEFVGSGRPLELPGPALGDYHPVEVPGGLEFEPISPPAVAGVRYRFEVGHCGLNHITDFDGSFWEPVQRQPGADTPSSLINSDRGTIQIVAPRRAIYTSSIGEKVGLLRIDGPVVRGGCD